MLLTRLLYLVTDEEKLNSLEARLAETETQFNSSNLDQQLKELKIAKEEQVTNLFYNPSGILGGLYLSG